MAYGMPRQDLLQASEAPTSYRAGFWGIARIGPREAGATVELGVRARLRGGGELEAELGARRDRGGRGAAAGGAPLVAIAMAAFEPPAELFRRQVESIRSADADRLDLRRQRRLLGSRTATRNCSGSLEGDARFVALALGPAARLLPQLRARAGARSGRRALCRPRRPGRRLGPRQARDAGPRDRRRAARLQRPADRRHRRGAGRRDVLVGAGQQPLGHAVAAGGELRHRRRLAVPARAARRRTAAPAGPVQRTSTTTGSPSRRSRSATSASSRGRSTTTSNTSTRRSGTRRRHGSARLRDRLSSLRRGPASGCGLLAACTTSSTPAGCSSSRPSSSCGAATG